MGKAASLLLLICISYSCQYECGPAPGLYTAFIGFSEQEVVSYTIKKYQKSSSFTILLDSVIVDSTKSRFSRNGDTLQIVATGSDILLSSSFDYRIVLPSANRTYNILNLEETKNKSKKSILPATKKYCINSYKSCEVNSRFIEIKGLDLYLVK
jgi:hypothetical protein